MTFKAKTIDEWCERKFPEEYETTNKTNYETPKTAEERPKEITITRPSTIQGAGLHTNLAVKGTRFERKCLVGKDEIQCYFHGWFQLNTPTKDGNSIAYPVGIVEHRDDGVVEQVKVTSIKFVKEFEEC